MAKTTANKGDVHELTEMEVQFVSLVPKGANRQERFLMVKTGQTLKAIPDKDATPEEKQNARQARSQKYGIEILDEGSALTAPSGFPTVESMYGDPVNLKYPWGDGSNGLDMGRLRNAIARFKQNYETYDETASREAVFERIVRKALAEGVDVSYDPDDPVDSLLPQDLKDTLTKGEGESSSNNSTENQDDTSGKTESKSEEMSGWLDSMSEQVDDLILESSLSKEEEEDVEEEEASPDLNQGVEDTPSVEEVQALQRKNAQLQKQLAEHRRALATNKEALRKEQLRGAKIRKSAIGGTSRLIVGELDEQPLRKSAKNEQLRKTWLSGGDMAK